MNKNKLGQSIEMLRKKKKMSQGQLAEGICTQPAVSQIEKGKVYPKVDTLYYFASKLDTSLSHFVEVLLEEPEEKQNEVIQKLNRLSTEQKHEEILTCIKGLSKPLPPWMKLFTSWLQYLSEYYLDYRSLKETIHIFKSLLQEEDPILIRRNHLHINIMNSIAFLYAADGRYLESLYYYDKILSPEEAPSSFSEVMDIDIYRIRVMYNKAKTLYDMGETAASLETIEAGIEASLQKESMALLGQFYYYKGQCYEKLDEEKEIICECYQRALSLFEILNKKLYSRLLWEHKSSFLNQAD
jgi:HTH-type transcriptional regulator, pleiotropic regulator of extracellular virulence genes